MDGASSTCRLSGSRLGANHRYSNYDSQDDGKLFVGIIQSVNQNQQLTFGWRSAIWAAVDDTTVGPWSISCGQYLLEWAPSSDPGPISASRFSPSANKWR